MTSGRSKAIGVLLLGFILAWHGIFVPSPLGAGEHNTKPACCCSGCDMKGCATPACCIKPSRPSTPVTPAPAPTSQNEWQALAALIAFSVMLPLPATSQFFTPSSSGFVVAAVPIFQRDCAYLL